MDENVVVSREWLADHLDEVTIVDVREAWEYEGIGHIPGAVNIPFDRFRSANETDAGMLPGAAHWAELLGEAGISADDTIVAYDDTHGVFAARFLVTALLYGHENLHLLDGDFSAWNREHPTTTEVPEVSPTEYEIREPDSSPLVGQDVVEAAIGSDAIIVDTRSPEEFAEGHIPGAVNLDWLELVDDESRGLREDSELETVLSERGITRDRRVVLYCNTARRISHTYVALAALGYENVDFYEGSLTEWTAEGGPIETES